MPYIHYMQNCYIFLISCDQMFNVKAMKSKYICIMDWFKAKHYHFLYTYFLSTQSLIFEYDD